MNRVKDFLSKLWALIRESKLNMGIFITGAIAFVLLMVFAGIIIFRGDGIDNTLVIDKETTTDISANKEEETTVSDEEEFSTEIDEKETTNVVNSATQLKISSSVSRSWIDDGEYYIQYNIRIENVSGRDISSWAVVLDMDTSYSLVDFWTFNYKEGTRKVIINPTNSNKEIAEGETISGGFIVKASSKYPYINYYTTYVGSKVETLRHNTTIINPTTTTTKDETDDETSEETTTEQQVTSNQPTSSDETTTSETKTTPEETTTLEEETTTPDSTQEETTTPEGVVNRP